MLMVNLGTAMAYLDLDTSGFNNGISSALSNLNTFTQKTATVSDKVTAVGATVKGLGKTLTTSVTLPIVGIGTAAVKTATTFESTMSKVSAISGATGEDLEALSNKAEEMGAKTKFTATEAAEAFTYMAMAGWKTEDMLYGIDGIMSLAAADGLDLATTSDIVTDALTAFNLTAEDSAHFADVLAVAASNSNTNVSMLGESFKYAASLAGTMGYSIEDVALALGLMANSGIKASQAGTALRGALTRLADPVDSAKMVLEKLGYYTEGYNDLMFDSEGNAKSFKEVLDSLRVSFSELTEEEQASYAKTLFGQQALSGMLAIINASEEDYNALADAISNADGAAESMSDTMLNNLSGAITILKSGLEGILLFIGQQVTPILTKFVQKLTAVVAAFNNLDDATKLQVVRFAAIAAAIGPVLVLVGSLITHIGSLLGSISTLKSVLSTGAGTIAGITAPVAIAVAAITSLIAIFVYLYNTSEEFRAGVNKLIDRLKSLGNEIKSRLAPYVERLKESFINLKDAIQPILEVFGEVFLNVLNTILDLIENLLPALDPLMEFVVQIIDMLSNVLNLVVAAFEQDEQLVSEYAEAIVENLKQIFSSAVDFIRSIFTGVIDTIRAYVDSTFGEGTFDRIFSPLISAVNEAFETIKSKFSEVIDRLLEAFEPLKKRYEESFQSLIDFWNEHGEDIIESTIKGLNDIMDLLQPLVDFIVNSLGPTINILTDVIEIFLIELDSLLALTEGDFERVYENSQKLDSKLFDMGKNLLEIIKNLGTAWVDFWETVGAKNQERDEKMRKMWIDFWEGFGFLLYDIIKDWKEDLKDFFLNVIPNLLKEAEDKLNTWWKNWKDGVDIIFSGTAIDGSHADGLKYVPFDGYIAELHKGERVLTAEENANYSQGGGSPVFNQYIVADTRIDRYEIQKDTEDLLAWGGVRV